MPRVPTYDNFTVMPGGLPGARIDTPQISDASGRQIEQFGQALMQAGRAAGTIAIDIQRDVNRSRVEETTMEAEKARNKVVTDFVQLQGKDALSSDIYTKYTADYDKTLSDLRGTLSNDAQRRAFDQYTLRYRADMSTKLNAHIFDQQKKYDTQVQEGRRVIAGETMALNWNNPQAIAEGRQSIIDSVKTQLKGAPDDYVVAGTIEALSNAHNGVVATAIDQNNYAYAKKYLEQFGAEIDQATRGRLEKAIQIGDTQVAGQAAARDVIANTGSDWTLKAVDDALVSKYSNDPKTLEVARSEARYLDQLRKDAKAQSETRLLMPVQDAIGTAVTQGQLINRSDAQALLAPLRASAPDLYLQAATKIDQHNDQIRAERNAAEKLAKQRHEDAVKIGLKGDEVSTASWYTLKTDPAKLRTVDLFDLRKQGLIGQKHFDDLVGDQQKLREGKIEENTLLSDKAAVDIVLKEAKITTDGKNVTGSDATNLALFYQAYNDRINNAGGSAKLTQNEKMNIARGLLKEVKVERKFWFDTTERVFKLSVEDVPVKDRQQIESALRSQNIPVTNSNILRMYQMGQ